MVVMVVVVGVASVDANVEAKVVEREVGWVGTWVEGRTKLSF